MTKNLWLLLCLVSILPAEDFRLNGNVMSGTLPENLRVASVISIVDDSTMLVKCSFTDTTRTLMSGSMSQSIEARSYLTDGKSKGKVKPAIAHWPQMFELDMHKIELLLVFSKREVEENLGLSQGFILHLNGIGQKRELVIGFQRG